MLLPGTHSFSVYGMSKGMYFVKVTGKNFNCSAKLICQCNLHGEAGIEHVASVLHSAGNHIKSSAATIDMPYTNGNILMYKGTSGQYSAVVTDVPTGSKTTTFPFVACTDSDGNHYATVQLSYGRSVHNWMAGNLKVGIGIDSSQAPTNNGHIEHYCYGDDVTNCNRYGGLYRWDEMMQYVETEGAQGICPNGWHIPTNGDWYNLLTSLGGYMVAGGKLKETGTVHWNAPNTGATNETGFTILPGGHREVWNGSYEGLGEKTFIWSSTQGSFASYYWYLSINYFYANAYTGDDQKEQAYSVRCIHD